MKCKSLIRPLSGLAVGILVASCSSSGLITTEPITYQNILHKKLDLDEIQTKEWGHLDLVRDTVPGMSVQRAYKEIIKKKKGSPVIVAVIDSGIDLEHEDLKDLFWTNSKEKPGDGIDNDQNGYIDDVHGYNFLGESFNEQLEFTRILKLKMGDEELQKKAKDELESKLPEAKDALPQIEQIVQMVSQAHETVRKKLGKDFYSLSDLE